MHVILVPLLFCAQALAQTRLLSRNFPHLIVPIKKAQPDTPFGTVKEFDIERDVYTLTSFDVPADVPSVYCGLEFTVNRDPSRGAPFKFWANPEPYRFNVTALNPNQQINKNTDTWNNHPEATQFVATIEVWSNGAVRQIGGQWFSCVKGRTNQYLVHPADVSGLGGVIWFELDDPIHGLTYNMYI